MYHVSTCRTIISGAALASLLNYPTVYVTSHPSNVRLIGFT
jgi:hypothetical protein